MSKYNSKLGFGRVGRSNRPWTRSNRVSDVQIFQKPYLSHPDSELDVLYMDLVLLDENYPIVVSKLPFEQLDQADLTGLSCRSNRVLRDLPNSGVNIIKDIFKYNLTYCIFTSIFE
jgi:hypothetical protein